MSGRKSGWTEQVALNLLRVVSGFLFWQHGAQKLFGMLGREAPVDFFTLMGLAGLLEVVGGALLVMGLFSRPVAFILSGQMAWAYFSVHAPNGFWPIMNNGELAALFSFLFLYIAARGGGAFSIDGIIALRRGKKSEGDAPKAGGKAKPQRETPVEDDIPELTEEDLAEDPEIAELLGDKP
jgi:putative oxidoreductase